MAKIQLDAASMLPVAGKTGRTQTAERSTFNRLLKDADRKAPNPAKTSDSSGSDSGRNQSVSGKEETPVKDSAPKEKEESGDSADSSVSGGETLSVEQLLLLQGAWNQPAAVEGEVIPVPEASVEMQPVGPEAAQEVIAEAVSGETASEILPETLTENTEALISGDGQEPAAAEVLPETAASEEICQKEPAVQENPPASAERPDGVPTAAEQAAEAENPSQAKETEDLSSFVLKNARQDSLEAAGQGTADKVKAVAEETRAEVAATKAAVEETRAEAEETKAAVEKTRVITEKFQADPASSDEGQAGVLTAQKETRSQTETGPDTQPQPYWQAGIVQPESRSVFSPEIPVQQTESIPVQTGEASLVSDIGRAIASHFPQNNGTLTIELEPASLGKLTIHVLYEGGKATVSILASNPRTLELLNQRATEMASILEEHTGQETIVYTEPPEPRQANEERQGGGREREREPEDREEKKKSEGDSFAQQLRLGLI